MAEYRAVQGSALRLKGVAELGVKKKKKKSKESKKMLEQITSNQQQQEEGEEAGEHKRPIVDKRTPAQKSFDKMQEKRKKSKILQMLENMKQKQKMQEAHQQIERILKKASKTHKQSVEEFNRHLDTLTEHYDIPKVSWTK